MKTANERGRFLKLETGRSPVMSTWGTGVDGCDLLLSMLCCDDSSSQSIVKETGDARCHCDEALERGGEKVICLQEFKNHFLLYIRISTVYRVVSIIVTFVENRYVRILRTTTPRTHHLHHTHHHHRIVTRQKNTTFNIIFPFSFEDDALYCS